MAIKNRVSRLMLERGENITGLMMATGIAYSTAHRLYHDKINRVDFETLDKLCRHFGVTPCEILEYVTDTAPAPDAG